MLRVVLDTNSLVSALITRGKPRALLRKIIDKKLTLVISNQIIQEFKIVMKRPKFQRYVDSSDIDEFLTRLIKISELIEVKSDFNIVKGDPTDDIILNCAYDGKVDYIVSGDEHLLALKNFKGIKIVTADETLKNIQR
jgi:hypothetical protein